MLISQMTTNCLSLRGKSVHVRLSRDSKRSSHLDYRGDTSCLQKNKIKTTGHAPFKDSSDLKVPWVGFLQWYTGFIGLLYINVVHASPHFPGEKSRQLCKTVHRKYERVQWVSSTYIKNGNIIIIFFGSIRHFRVHNLACQIWLKRLLSQLCQCS